MYAKYEFVAGASAANILADLQALLTGTTDISALSASCNKANSYVLNGASQASWLLHDAAAGSGKVCLKSPFSDDPTKFHFALLTVSATAVYLGLYENWNATTHVGSNLAPGSDASNGTGAISASAGGQIYLTASPRHIGIHACTLAGNFNTAPVLLAERTRRSPWDTVANGYPTGVLFSNSSSTIPRGLNMNGNDVYNGVGYPLCNNWSPYYSGQDTQSAGWNGSINGSANYKGGIGVNPRYSPLVLLPDASKMRSHAIVPFGIGDYNDNTTTYGGFLGGEVSSKADIWLTTWNYGASLDELTVGADTYVIWGAGSARLAVRKG